MTAVPEAVLRVGLIGVKLKRIFANKLPGEAEYAIDHRIRSVRA